MIDCHTHWHPEWSGASPTDPSPWLAMLERYEVSHAVVLPTRGLMDDTLITTDHDDMAAAAHASGGRMLPFATARLWQGERALTEIDRCLGPLGFRGLKFHPWLQCVSINHPLMDAVCERAEAAQVPILFHDGTPPFSLPSQVALLAKRHPRTTMILGHCGLLEFWEESIATLRQRDNVWGCLCSPHPGALREIIRHSPLERLCWGSDFGFGKSDLISYRLRLLRAVGLDEFAERKILVHNPRRLLRI